jgi:X-X-X-Leu-X-X-Gly heptad repeat protein
VQSSYRSSATTLVGDARHAADVLNISTTSSADLHTVCGVLLVDTESANASLPTPDARATTLLSNAYTNLGAGANECYVASSDVRARTKALKSLANGLADLSEGSARLTSASAR